MTPPPPSYKPIQPALIADRDKLLASSRSSAARARHAKRLKAVTQACYTCRRYKARCDGVRPRCSGCVAKDKPCGYDGEEGQSRQAAMKSRLEALEKLVGALQAKPPEEAERLLQRIRTADDIVSLSSSGSYDDSNGAASGESNTGTRSDSDQLSPPFSAPATSSESWQTTQATACALEPRLSSPNRTHTDPSAYLIRLIIPSAQLTRAAIQSFYSSSGKLFHVFSPEQIDVHLKSVFGLDGRPNASQRVAICCLCAVAAIGIQYNAVDFDKGAEQIFYDVARHYFVDVIEERPLEAIKVCTMLAMYNVMDKATVALAYVEVALGMSRRHSLNTAFSPLPSLMPDAWEDYRRTWRTLMFFSSWLSSTLGYISGNGDSAFQKLVPLAETEIDHTSEIGEIVQAEMTKICMLKAEVLRMHLASKELTNTGIDCVMNALQDWHGRLPQQMHLSNLGRQDLTDQVRRSIFHVHLLYLGAIILLYRRVACQFVQSYNLGGQLDNSTADKSRARLLDHAEKGIIAARHSARILGLLLAERGIFRRCWLVIFQSHTACVALLHSVAQKQIHKFPSSSWLDDLKLAQICLDTLEFCGTIDSVALRFHVRLSGIYSNLVDFSPTGQSTLRRAEEYIYNWVTMPPDFPPLSNNHSAPETTTQDRPSLDYLLAIPRDASKQMVNLSFSLLLALCRPWGDPINSGVKEQAQNELDWGTEQTLPFSWDTTGMGIKTAESVDVNLFLGSEEPSGWSRADDIEIYDEEESYGVEPTAVAALG
ncbi:hypothetical protein B0H67DRAFT_178870 [Lasiosphaeris hirsuta]|uniref:Zn(2)-C6 fungal-type domain-containing protein n=1 Tax=Lasiosphaeris hirsuta TaxID=260670 RepID=A0AA40AQK9_9PEZI|nr:hypothetical protein B0H67DRAFT_178870 [Lasiosphaeris hirsuta]